MLIQLVDCYWHLASHFSPSHFALSHSLSTSACRSLVQSSENHHFIASGLCLSISRVTRLYFFQLSPLPPSIHPSRRHTQTHRLLWAIHLSKERALLLGQNTMAWCGCLYWLRGRRWVDRASVNQMILKLQFQRVSALMRCPCAEHWLLLKKKKSLLQYGKVCTPQFRLVQVKVFAACSGKD